MVRIEKINGKNVWDILKLKVQKEQEAFVASNEVSMIEAYVALTCGGHAFPFGIYEDSTPVGFLMVIFDTDDGWENPPKIAKNNYCVLRLMIDETCQHKGYGRKALQLALDFINTKPCGPAEYCWISYEPENKVAKNLYQSFGFKEIEEKDGDETIAVLKL